MVHNEDKDKDENLSNHSKRSGGKKSIKDESEDGSDKENESEKDEDEQHKQDKSD
jgi:hypothetical protein